MCVRIPRGPVQQPLEDRIFTPAVSAVYSTVTQVARQPGPPAPSPYPAHEINKGHPALAATPPGHASSPGLTQFAAGPRPAHHQFFQRPQIQPPRATIQNSSPSLRPGAQTPTAVYQANQHIMMVNHLPMPYPMPQGPQYCIPQYRHSGPPYVGPPQQYPVQPPGPGPFYPGPGPGEFPNAYGKMSPYGFLVFWGQIRIRDPNQGGRDITEEIMSGGGSRNPTPPAVRPTSTPTPPQQLPGQVPEHSPVACGTVDALPSCQQPHRSGHGASSKVEEKPKTDPVLKSPSPALRPEPSGERKEQTSLEPPGPAGAPSLAVVPPSRSPLAPGSQDGCELASPPQEAPLLPRAGPCLELPSCPLEEEADPERCREEPSRIVPNDLHQTPSANLINELNGVPERVTLSDDVPELGGAKEAVLPALELASEEPEVECAPPAASVALPSSPSPPPRPPHSPLALPVAPVREEELGSDCVWGVGGPPPGMWDLRREAPGISQLSAVGGFWLPRCLLGQRGVKSARPLLCSQPQAEEALEGEQVPEAEQGAGSLDRASSPSDLKVASAMEENGEQEGEAVRNGAEREGGCAESSNVSATTEQWKPGDTEGKKQYDRDFLLDFQFMPACIQKPEGLPPISDVVLDKINQPKLPLRTLDSRILARGPDFTPAFADFGRQVPGGRGGALLNVGPRRSQPSQRREPRKIITVCVKEDVHLKKAENAWKPSLKRETQVEDPESIKTQELFRKVRSILNKLTPQMFNQLMKQVTDLTVDTEERLKGVIDLVFEKAIDEPSFSVAYANMCRGLVMLKVPMADKPGSTVNFRKLLLNRCQKEFEKDKADDDVFEKKQKELEAATTPEERTRLHDELEEAKDKARRRSIGNIKFIGELFKLKMLTEAIMHDCVVKLLKNHDEESLECLCRLLTTIGKDLDFEKAKPRMDQYFNQMEKIVKERKTSSRIRFMLQDVIDLRQCNWVSRRADQGPKTIEQIHKEAKIEEQEEQRKVQQLMTKEKRRPGVQRVEEGGWNTVQGAKNSRVLDPTKFLKITKPSIDEKIQLVPKAQLGSWGKGSSGGAKASEIAPCFLSSPACAHSSALLPSSRGSTGREKNDNKLPAALDNQAQEEQRREMLETVKQLTGGLESNRTARRRRRSEAPVPHPHEKPALSDEEIESPSQSQGQEAMQCVEELNVPGILPVFVQVGVESTLERSQITRDHMGQLLHQLVQSEKLSKQDFFKGFSDTLETADDMAIDIPHIWLYLAELVTPMLKEGGISMRELVIEFSKPLLPVRRAGVLLSKILHLLCKQMSHKKVAALWREAGLSWRDLLPEEDDVHAFLLEQKLDFTETDSPSSSEALSPRELSAEELNRQLEKLIVDEEAGDEQIFDWVEANLDESQMSSPTFLRALMTAVCKAALLEDSSSLRVDTAVIKRRVPILLKYLDSDTEKELQALYALQASIVKLDQPPNLLRMFFDCLYDEEVISEDAFYKWESSKDPAEQNGKGVALKSVTAFFTWLREAEEESEDN
uniref:Eukaryotic translation initiation factor 4 gamma 3 n=1 Tax=Naja naja TaxID=35670 RepID=A0A8C7E6Z4_NAJNA